MRKGFKEYSERLKRLVAIIKLKNSGNAETIAKRFDISGRQVYNDINYLKTEYNAPIVFNRSINSYEFCNTDFEIEIFEVRKSCKNN
ncbi:MAG: HTH domain-containing protein [Bacteroidales bacterium]|jgi:predicted DNA-binding transcriptional regulator YafY